MADPYTLDREVQKLKDVVVEFASVTENDIKDHTYYNEQLSYISDRASQLRLAAVEADEALGKL